MNNVKFGVARVAKAAFSGLLGAGLVFSMAACSGTANSSSSANGKSVNVIASVNQWGSLAKEIGGNKVKVTSILSNPNVEAHEYEPSTSDIAKFSSANVTIYNGADYDSWASKAAKDTKAAVIDVADAAGVKDGENPHIWFDSEARAAAAKKLLAAYKKADPTDAKYFTKQYDAWKTKESKLSETMSSVASKLNGSSYAATEAVAAYLAEDLGLKDATPTGFAQAVANESEPAPADISEFTSSLENGEIKLLFVNDQEADDTTKLVEKAAEKGNVALIHITESMPKKYSTLAEWMTAITAQVESAVK